MTAREPPSIVFEIQNGKVVTRQREGQKLNHLRPHSKEGRSEITPNKNVCVCHMKPSTDVRENGATREDELLEVPELVTPLSYDPQRVFEECYDD